MKIREFLRCLDVRDWTLITYMIVAVFILSILAFMDDTQRRAAFAEIRDQSEVIESKYTALLELIKEPERLNELLETEKKYEQLKRELKLLVTEHNAAVSIIRLGTSDIELRYHDLIGDATYHPRLFSNGSFYPPNFEWRTSE